jgi:hypothetical protein
MRRYFRVQFWGNAAPENSVPLGGGTQERALELLDCDDSYIKRRFEIKV